MDDSPASYKSVSANDAEESNNKCDIVTVKEYVVACTANNTEEFAVLSLGTESKTAEPMIENIACLGPNINRQQNVKSSSDDKVICSSELDVKLTAEVHTDPTDLEIQPLLLSEGKLDITKSLEKPAGTSSRCLSVKAEVTTATIVNLEYCDCKLEESSRKAPVVGNNTTNTDGSASKTLQSTKLSHAPVKKTVSEAKDSAPNSSAKTSTMHSNPASSCSAVFYLTAK